VVAIGPVFLLLLWRIVLSMTAPVYVGAVMLASVGTGSHAFIVLRVFLLKR
jgi:hypothetical protein